jgi:hypothetical protein
MRVTNTLAYYIVVTTGRRDIQDNDTQHNGIQHNNK